MTDSKGHAHTKGGATTRDDATDLGVSMGSGDPPEDGLPEDAFEPDNMGDYSHRLDAGPHIVMEPIEDAKPGEPNVRAVNVTERARVRVRPKG